MIFQCGNCGLKLNIKVWPLYCQCGAKYVSATSEMQLRERSNAVETVQQKVFCEHRGEVSRLVQCETCSGNVQIKVYTCSKNGECTVGVRSEGIAICQH